MEVIQVDNYSAMSEKAARMIEEQICKNDRSILGLATGSTPLGLYEKLIEGHKTCGVSYKNVQSINLDEYLGLDKNHPGSYHTFMYENLFKEIDISMEHVYIPNSKPLSAGEECQRYDQVIERIGPIDLQILGIGSNGHIGFNEPGSDPNSTTHVVELAASTRKDNAHFFDSIEEVPTHAVTMGIKSILKSARILVLASGKRKAEAVKRLLNKDLSESFPASHLWNHEDVTLIVDTDAYKLVSQKGSEDLAR
ncbi:glucosamine-6-phosphate deaminase [Paenisporosarcina sp. TG-14]|uniref:glucosamine-6-phosphate deaminase n=1 Tax=Paenisporosarcina sp. TG-14 TaxID=1231057 RepID=UPI0002FBD27A|nr:glucosamine-6-phosphate deaminase [Paenisporosarcina sp. TG-14]